MSSSTGRADGSSFIPLSVPVLGGNEARYLTECVETNWVSSAGPFVDRFELEFAAFVDSEHAVAVSNGTAAIHLALIAAGVRADDEVIVPAMTFIAPVNAVRYVGAWPVIVDVEASSWQLDHTLLAEFIETQCDVEAGVLRNRKTGRRVSAILPVHILGHPVNLAPILELARRHGLVVVEDSTESLGARYGGKSTGSIGKLGCFSFNGNKLITSGGGGMVVTDDGELAARVRYLSTQAKDDSVEYVHGEVGYNYRLTNIQAAMGVAQLEQIDGFIESKHEIARRYTEAFESIDGITVMPDESWAERMPWLYTILLDPGVTGIESRELIAQLDSAGIQARPLWEPMHVSRAFGDGERFECSVADMLYERAVSLPSSSDLSAEDQSRVIDQVIDGTRTG
jgi:perosamine synthetase